MESLKENRDLKAAKTILHVGKCNNNFIPMEHREFKPVEKMTSILISPYIKTSYFDESGSQVALALGSS